MRFKSICVAMLSLLMVSSIMFVCIAQEAEQEKVELPEAVVKALANAYPKAEIIGFEAEQEKGGVTYEVECRIGDVKKDILYSADGTVIRIEEEIAVSSLPEIVTKAIAGAYPEGEIEEADMISRDSIVEYEVAVEVGEDEYEAIISSDGKIIASDKIATDDDDDDDDDDEEEGDDDDEVDDEAEEEDD